MCHYVNLSRHALELQCEQQAINRHVVSGSSREDKKGAGVETAETIMVKLTFEHLVELARNVVNGFSYLVEHGFVHRDLTSRNVFLDANCNAKIANFGMARNKYNMRVSVCNHADFIRTIRCCSIYLCSSFFLPSSLAQAGCDRRSMGSPTSVRNEVNVGTFLRTHK